MKTHFQILLIMLKVEKVFFRHNGTTLDNIRRPLLLLTYKNMYLLNLINKRYLLEIIFSKYFVDQNKEVVFFALLPMSHNSTHEDSTSVLRFQILPPFHTFVCLFVSWVQLLSCICFFCIFLSTHPKFIITVHILLLLLLVALFGLMYKCRCCRMWKCCCGCWSVAGYVLLLSNNIV